MPVVNLNALKTIMDNDLELIQDCFSDFEKESPELLSQIRQAISIQEPKKVKNLAHKLKGMLIYLAAEPAANAALAIEQAGQNQNFQGIGQKFAALEGECKSLGEFINEFNSGKSPT